MTTAQANGRGKGGPTVRLPEEPPISRMFKPRKMHQRVSSLFELAVPTAKRIPALDYHIRPTGRRNLTQVPALGIGGWKRFESLRSDRDKTLVSSAKSLPDFLNALGPSQAGQRDRQGLSEGAW